MRGAIQSAPAFVIAINEARGAEMEIGVFEHFVPGAAAFDPPVARLQNHGVQFLVFHEVFDTAFEAHFLFLITDGKAVFDMADAGPCDQFL
jgi:hypothetical protein